MPPDALVEIGIEAYYDAAFDRAGAALRLAKARAIEAADARAEARARIWLAQVGRQRGELSEARRLAEAALEGVLREGIADLEPQAYSTLGFVAWYQNRLAEAARLFERSLERARELRDDEGISRAANNLAQIHHEWGDFARARAGFETTREAGQAMGNPYHEAIALVNLGMLDVELGDPLSAIPRLESARRLFLEHGYEDWEGYPLSHMGVAYLKLGDFRAARENLERALAIARAHDLPSEAAQELRLLGDLYRSVGGYPRALELYHEAAEIETALGGVLESGADLRSIAEVHAAVGDLETAAARASEALRLHSEGGARYQELRDRLVLAEVAFLRGRRDEADRHLEAARALAADLDARAGRVHLSLAEARIADASEDSRRVHGALDGIRDDLPRGGFASEWEAARLRARAHLREGRPEDALAAARRAAEIVEGVRGNLGSGVMGTAYTAARTETYADLVAVLLRLGRPGDAFTVADRAQGVGFREHLPAAGSAVRAMDAAAGAMLDAEEQLHRIHRLVESLDSLETVPPRERDRGFDEAAQDLSDRLFRARRDYEASLERSAATGPGAALLGSGTVRVDEVQAVLRPGEVLVEYLVAPDRIVVFGVTPEGLHVAEGPLGARNLASRVRLALSLLRSPETAADPAAASVLERLYAALLEPVARTGALAGAERVIIVPHGVLAYLPFAALRDPVTRRHLAEDYAVLHAPSAGVLATLRTSGRRAEERSGGIRAFAPFPEALPATEREVARLAREEEAETMVGPAAREAAVRRALVQDRTVHVATHGVMNPRNPLFSRIELVRAGPANGGTADPSDDGRLEVHEVLGLSVRAPLVFLSGCETGLGSAWGTEFTPGADYATLDRAFLYAGARNVVATLWRVEDEGAADFVAEFYRELRSAPPAEALARAQRRMLDRGDGHASPFHWAAYRVSGVGW